MDDPPFLRSRTSGPRFHFKCLLLRRTTTCLTKLSTAIPKIALSSSTTMLRSRKVMLVKIVVINETGLGLAICSDGSEPNTIDDRAGLFDRGYSSVKNLFGSDSDCAVLAISRLTTFSCAKRRRASKRERLLAISRISNLS